MSVYIVRNNISKWFFEILSTSGWIIVFTARSEKGYIFTRAVLNRQSRILRRRHWKIIAQQRYGRQISFQSKSNQRWCVVIVPLHTVMGPHLLALVVRVFGGESDGSHRLGHHQTTCQPHGSYGLFNRQVYGIFGSTLRLHVGNGMVTLCLVLDALFYNKRKVTSGHADFWCVWESHMVKLAQFMWS